MPVLEAALELMEAWMSIAPSDNVVVIASERAMAKSATAGLSEAF